MSATDLRDTIAGLLRMIASKDEQLEYAARAGTSVPAELDCGWFDDLYHPDDPLFREAFDETERSHLAAFHAVYAARDERLPMSLYERLMDPAWAEVMAAAQRVLDEFNRGEGG
jgi:hypothetical protein